MLEYHYNLVFEVAEVSGKNWKMTMFYVARMLYELSRGERLSEEEQRMLFRKCTKKRWKKFLESVFGVDTSIGTIRDIRKRFYDKKAGNKRFKMRRI